MARSHAPPGRGLSSRALRPLLALQPDRRQFGARGLPLQVFQLRAAVVNLHHDFTDAEGFAQDLPREAPKRFAIASRSLPAVRAEPIVDGRLTVGAPLRWHGPTLACRPQTRDREREAVLDQLVSEAQEQDMGYGRP